jgi:hypothetical protein
MVALVAIVVGCTKDGANGDYRCAVADNSVFVVRCNLNQLLEKSGEKHRLIEKLRTKLESEDMPDYILEMAKDLRCAGIEIEAPIFVYAQEIDESTIFLGVVAKTYCEGLFDNIVKRTGRGHIVRTEESDYTMIQREGCDGIALAYNEVAAVLGFVVPKEGCDSNDSYDAKPYVVEAVQRAYNGNGGGTLLPADEKADVAVCGHVESLQNICKSCYKGLYGKAVLKILESLHGAEADLTLNFENGSIDCNLQLSNAPAIEGGYGSAMVKVSSLFVVPWLKSEMQKLGGGSTNWQNPIEDINLSTPTSDSFSMQLIFKNRSENPLVQIADAIKQIEYKSL